LRIENGDQVTGQDRVSSATVILNGVEIAGTSDFNQQVAVIERPVNLGASNTLTVRLSSKPGSYLTISVADGDTTPPHGAKRRLDFYKYLRSLQFRRSLLS
jgi:hypothetical protein